jgi:hypothetical protein
MAYGIKWSNNMLPDLPLTAHGWPKNSGSPACLPKKRSSLKITFS